MSNSSSQKDRDEVLEFLSHQWIPVRQMLRTMSRGDSLTNDIFVNCLVREFRVPNRLIPALSKIVLESCRYHDVVHTETLRKKVDDHRRQKEEEAEAEFVRQNNNADEFGNNNNPKYYFANNNNSSSSNNKSGARPQTSQPRGSALNATIYQPPRLQPDAVTQQQMDLLRFQQQQSSQRTADRFSEFFDEGEEVDENGKRRPKKKNPLLKNPPLPKTEAQKEREKLLVEMGKLPPPRRTSSSSSSNNNNNNSNNMNKQQQQPYSSIGVQAAAGNQKSQQQQRPGTAGPNMLMQRSVETQTPTRQRQNSGNENQNQQKSIGGGQSAVMTNLSQPKKNFSLDARELQQQQQQHSAAPTHQHQHATALSASHRGCTPKVDLAIRREALRAQFLKATSGVSVVCKQLFYKALNSITPWDIEADEFQELYDNVRQPNGKVHVDDFCHKFVEDYVQNSSSFAVSMKPCFAPITKSPRYYHHPNLSLSRSASATGGGNGSGGGNNSHSGGGSAGIKKSGGGGGGASDLLSRSSIVAKAQREKEEREREARRVVRLTRSSEFRKEVGALFRKTVDSYDGYIQCGIIPSSPKRRPSSGRRMAAVGSAGVVNSATVHIPEPPLGTAKFCRINTRIEADPSQLGNHPSPRIVSHH